MRVLCVEDDREVRQALALVLEDEGYVVATAETAEEGLDRLAAGDWDLLITDYGLPRKDGGWLLEAARARGLLERTRALVLTATPERATRIEGVPVFSKPLDVTALLRWIPANLPGR